jgi:hypothetical protein
VIAYNAAGEVIVSVPVPLGANSSVQTIAINADGVRRLVFDYQESGIHGIEVACPQPTPTASQSRSNGDADGRCNRHANAPPTATPTQPHTRPQRPQRRPPHRRHRVRLPSPTHHYNKRPRQVFPAGGVHRRRHGRSAGRRPPGRDPPAGGSFVWVRSGGARAPRTANEPAPRERKPRQVTTRHLRRLPGHVSVIRRQTVRDRVPVR